MSLESGSGLSASAAPLQYEIWSELRVKAQPDSWLPPYPVHNTNYFFKFVHDTATASFCIIITDLCFVWLRRVDQKTIDADMKKYNPSIRKKTTNHTITMLTELLKQNNSQQFHLVRLEAPEGWDEEAAAATAAAAESHSKASKRSNSVSHLVHLQPSFTPELHLESSMSLGGLISFKWKFHLHSYGGPLEQCAFLRSQMYLPLHEMIKILSYQVQAEKKRYEKLQNSISSHGNSGSAPMFAAAAGGGRGGGNNDLSLSCDLPSLSTAEREAQANRLGGAVAAAVPAANFDEFANGFSFGQVGDLYVSALNRLSGEDGSLGGLGGASQLSYDPSGALPQPSQPMAYEMEEERKPPPITRPSAADRKQRGVKRDRSPSPSPNPRSSTSVAAAAAGGGGSNDRDPDMDYKHNEDYLPSPSFPPPSHSGDAGFGSASLLHGSIQSSLDIGGVLDEDGVYRESEAEKNRREMLARQLSAQKKKKKKKAFV